LFGRLFPSARGLTADLADLTALAASMRDPGGPELDSKIPAGFTYLGQFIDHDITLDLTSIDEMNSDPDGKENFRTPALDLDSVYGFGPEGSPHLYERDPATLRVLPTLLLGTAMAATVPPVPALVGGDLPRVAANGTAIIGDPRNDENLLVAQVHLAFLHFHNAVVADLRRQNVAESEVFAEARRKVVWHYQWMVLHEFLETLTGEVGITDRIIARGRRFFRFKKWPFMPVEFAAGAYRLGHSMVQETYDLNRFFRPGGVAPADLAALFRFSAKSGEIAGDLRPDGLVTLPSSWVIDWRRFFDVATPPGAETVPVNRARKIDTLLAAKLHDLPGGAVLPLLNLRRGVQKRLPSGQAVAAAMSLPAADRLTPAEIATGPDGAVARAHGFDRATPLWFYILKEAQVKGGGEHLGPVGATIVAEVLIGLVQGNDESYLGAKPDFVPTLGAKPGEFTMVDLLNYAYGHQLDRVAAALAPKP
jgi:hypothetical protein